MKIAGVEDQSIVDGPGFRYTVFFQGCSHACPHCHNQQTWDFAGGAEINTSDLVEKIKSKSYIDGVTLSGGEPFEQPEAMLELSSSLKNLGYHIIAYTGYTYEQLLCDDKKKAVLPFLDVIIDGKFEEVNKSLALRFRGSTNQRVIDVPSTLKEEKIIELNWEKE